jgi:hypothetical protein
MLGIATERRMRGIDNDSPLCRLGGIYVLLGSFDLRHMVFECMSMGLMIQRHDVLHERKTSVVLNCGDE